MGSGSNLISSVIKLAVLTVYTGRIVADCPKLSGDIIPPEVCDKSDIKDVRFPTPSCAYYDDKTLKNISFTSTYGSDVNIASGENIELQCEAMSTKRYLNFAVWLCRRTSDTLLGKCLCPETAIESKYSITSKSDPDTTKLTLNYTLQNVSHSTTDRYFCLVQVGLSDTVVDGFGAIDVNVRDISKPEIMKGPRSVSVRAGTELTLTCKARGFPKVSYLWFKDGELLDKIESSILPLSWDTSISSYHINVTSSSDEGEYKCVAFNSVGNATSEGALVAAEIDMPTSKPAMTGPDKDATIIIGAVVAVFLVLVAIVIGVVIYKRVVRDRRQQSDHEEKRDIPPINVSIGQTVEANNFIVKVEGHGADVTCNFMGDVNIGGRALGDQIEGGGSSTQIHPVENTEEASDTASIGSREPNNREGEHGDENQPLNPLIHAECDVGGDVIGAAAQEQERGCGGREGGKEGEKTLGKDGDRDSKAVKLDENTPLMA